MTVWFAYIHLVLLDLWRLRPLVLPQVFVVAGICLPILLLQGLKRGHVQELRRDLLTSPTGRQVRFWTTQEAELLTSDVLHRLGRELPGIELIIPDTHHIGSLTATKGGKLRRVGDITFETTRRGDPVLKLAECDVLDEGETAVVLSKFIAQELGVGVGDGVRLEVNRMGGDVAGLDLTVKAIDTRGDDRKVGYLDAGVHENIEQFLRGSGVAEYRWPTSNESASDTYTSYLIFCRKDDDLGAKDRAYYEKDRNFLLRPVEDESLRTLYGLLRKHDLFVYTISREKGRLRDNPDDLAARTDADEVLVPWCEPRVLPIDGMPHRVLGLSLPRRTWLKGYLRSPGSAFEYDAPELSVLLPSTVGKVATLGPRKIPLATTALKGTDATADPPVAVVPVQLLAHLDMEGEKLVQYDTLVRRFVPLPEPFSHARARLYAKTIDDVPAVVQELGRRGMNYASENSRIREIHKQDSSLEFIVVVVGIGVLVFGVFTVANVLLDSTARKRGTLGILRVMGVSRGGVFFLVFLRAALIGVLAGGLSLLAGLAVAWLLRLVPVLISIRVFDLAAVFVCSIVCCVVGSLYPAWTASRVDPYETIIEGKFR